MDIYIDLITQLGFPITAVIALSVFVYKIYKRSEDREDKLTEQLEKSQEVNAKAIETLTVYNERLGNIETDVKTIKDEILK